MFGLLYLIVVIHHPASAATVVPLHHLHCLHILFNYFLQIYIYNAVRNKTNTYANTHTHSSFIPLYICLFFFIIIYAQQRNIYKRIILYIPIKSAVFKHDLLKNPSTMSCIQLEIGATVFPTRLKSI